MNITYFVNHYPKVSHTFIRREIQALEQEGFTVSRVSIHKDDITDTNNPDYAEIPKTQYILKPSPIVLIKALLSLLLTEFSKTLSAFFLCIRMMKTSDRSVLKNLVYFLEGLRLAQICKTNGTQHIHAHFGTNSTDVAMYCSLVTNIPYSFTVHGPEEFDRPLSINLTEKIVRSRFVFAITKFCKSQLQRWVSHDQWDKIKIIRCGLDPSFFDDQLSIEKINSEKISALFIGRLCEQKGPLIAMEALKMLRESGVPIEIIFAGDGELRSDVERYAQENGLQDSIKITGWVDSSKIRELLLDCDFMLLPSFAEGLPVAIMEALASKVPVVTTRIAGIPELVRPRETGFIVAPGCAIELVEAINELLALNQSAYTALIENAYAAVKLNHDASIEAKKIAQYFRENAT
ncbi:glycosyltransferase family 4 protein [Glaciecola petra]|uniref:Glycosyltransferase family 4 protein n=1 Tax=Glaciecola petra TaxID=3075602 RepID=A0ABU2ZTI0_9ALTE|nr:glycosyltransferase family 4 protein [Aestuariibacter sp. P117]MDT0595951.1 glycosyltransferase family 4 protein [Aestuariibacter sp. P117]